MPHPGNESQTVNIYGGRGGNGGGGGIQGGGGGAGNGPTVNFTTNIESQGEAGIHILHRAVTLEALYDSADRFPQPKCHPETRTELLNDLYHWANDPDSDYSILWLHGPAGAGKSAVMQTLCQRLQDAGRLGGSFFFKGDHKTCGNAKMLFATLAYQLALHQRELKGPISRSVETDPSVLGRGMDVQLRTLILEPCRLFPDARPSVLLVDGLDECEGHNIQKQILHLIGSTAKDHCIQLRILVASRPEPHIRETFEEDSFRGLFGSINIEQSFEDIRTYLRDEFSRIHREHSTTMRHIPIPWPSSQILEMIVQKSSGYFIYASTVIKFIDDECLRPSKQLDIIRNLGPHDSESPFKDLDQLYLKILSGVPAQFHPSLRDILSVIINYPGLPVEEIDELLDLDPGDAQLILRPLHSVLKISTEFGRIQAHHASFRDFLNSHQRSSVFYIGFPQQRMKLARSILKALAYTHDDPQQNRADLWFRWYIATTWPIWIRNITSITPSPDFVHLVRLVNPDFVFSRSVPDETFAQFLFWLKKICPLPEDVIRRWEDYRFMQLYEHFQDQVTCSLLDAHAKWAPERTYRQIEALSVRTIHALRPQMNSKLQVTINAFRQLLSQSPTLVRILQAERLLTVDHSITLFQIRIALDLSWDDVRECICSLRPLMTKASGYFLFLFSLDILGPKDLVSRDLARGLIQLIQRIGNGKLPMRFWWHLRPDEWHFREWGRHIRSSPQSNPELLQELHQFIPPWDVFAEEENRLEPVEFYDVVQWLKRSPNPQLDLIDRWQGYLRESMVQTGKNYGDDELEERWNENLEMEAYLHGPSQVFDKEVIRCWESVLQKYTSSGGGSEEEEDSDDEADM